MTFQSLTPVSASSPAASARVSKAGSGPASDLITGPGSESEPGTPSDVPISRARTLEEFFNERVDERVDERIDTGIPDAFPDEAPPDTRVREATTVLRCSSTADFLAALPSLTGFTAENSLFVVLFDGRRSNRALRIDLPESESPEACGSFLETLTQMLDAVGGHSGPALVISSAVSFAEAAGAPWRRLAKRIERRLSREGHRPRAFAGVAPDGWVSYLDPTAPRSGRPLSEISSSPIAREAAEFRENAPVDLEAVGRIPKPNAALAQQVCDALWRMRSQGDTAAAASNVSGSGSGAHASTCSGTSTSTSTAERVRLAAANAGVAYSRRAATESAEVCARLAHDAQHESGWLVLALTALTRAEFVAGLAAENDAAMFEGLTAASEADLRGPRRGNGSIRDLLYSLAHEPPERRKLERAIAALTQAVAHCPREYQPGLLSLLGWAWWMVGLQSVSARHVEHALEIDSRHALTLMVDRLTSSIPAWYLRDQAAA